MINIMTTTIANIFIKSVVSFVLVNLRFKLIKLV